MTDDRDTEAEAMTDEEINAAIGRLAALLIPETDFLDPKVRAVMEALNSTGTYRETPEDFAWLCTDTRGILSCAPTGDPASIAGALLESLHCQDDSEAERECLQLDIAVISATIQAVG